MNLSGRKWILRGALVLGVLFLALVAAAFFFPKIFLCVDSGPVKADVIVLLGGGLGERPERAAELFKERAAPRIIVSGLGDCEINRRLLLKAGVPDGAVQLEGRSRTTKENAQFTIQLLREQGVRRVIIVTSWYHSRRALKTFQHFAPEMKFYSRPSYFAFARADWLRQKISRRIYLEFLKLPGYWIRYGVNPF
ncbi:MAG TPA: YdcF family protein [Verrucomicrobiae bacterium]